MLQIKSINHHSVFLLLLMQQRKNSGVVVAQERIVTWHAKTSTDQLQYFTGILLNLHHPIASLASLIQEYLCLVWKLIRTNTENSVEVGLFVTSLIHSFSFVYSNSHHSFTHLVLFIQIQSNTWPAFLL